MGILDYIASFFSFSRNTDTESDTMIIGNGKYVTTRKLGQGGFGEVYEAWNLDDKKIVAIKLLKTKPEKKRDVGSMVASIIKANDPDKDAKRELKAVLELHHSNIVQLIDVGFDEKTGKVYIVMEKCDGDLASFLKAKGGRLSESEIEPISGGIVKGLHHIHDKGMMHRDLKPANILMKDGITKIADLGLVTKSSASPEMASEVGSEPYMAPEISSGSSKYDKKVDIYSLGLITYELLGGRDHFDKKKRLRIIEKKEKISAPSGASPAMKSLVYGMLETNPMKRMDINQVKTHAFFERYMQLD